MLVCNAVAIAGWRAWDPIIEADAVAFGIGGEVCGIFGFMIGCVPMFPCSGVPMRFPSGLEGNDPFWGVACFERTKY